MTRYLEMLTWSRLHHVARGSYEEGVDARAAWVMHGMTNLARNRCVRAWSSDRRCKVGWQLGSEHSSC